MRSVLIENYSRDNLSWDNAKQFNNSIAGRCIAPIEKQQSHNVSVTISAREMDGS